MAFAGDGFAFLDASYLVIRKLAILLGLLCLGLMVLAILLAPGEREKRRFRLLAGCGPLTLGALGIAAVCLVFFRGADTMIWDMGSDPATVYENFTDTRSSLSLLGIYHYTFRDIQLLRCDLTEGQPCPEGDVLRLAKADSELLARFTLPAAQAEQLTAGQTVTLTQGSRQTEATVRTVSAADETAGTASVTAVLPEDVKSQFITSIPAGRAGTPQDVAGVAAFLVSDDAAYLQGQVIAVDGGVTMQ